MTYSKSTLQKLAKEVLHRHPDIATAILSQMPTPQSREIDRIPLHFEVFCLMMGIDQNYLAGPTHSQQATETKRVFISAMARIYYGNKNFHKKISETLNQCLSVTSRMLDEVLFRYEKDRDFKIQVDNILNKLENDSRAA